MRDDRKGIDEALTKEVRARLSSREIHIATVCRRSPKMRKATLALAIKRVSTGHCEVQDPMHASKLLTRESGDPNHDQIKLLVCAVNPVGARQR